MRYNSLEEYAVNDELERLYPSQLQKWLKEQKVWYHPKAGHKSLVTLVKKQMQAKLN